VESPGELKANERQVQSSVLTREVNRRCDVCCKYSILKVLQLLVVTTSEDPINPFTNPNPRLSHCDT
jgi:hypothetical protein